MIRGPRRARNTRAGAARGGADGGAAGTGGRRAGARRPSRELLPASTPPPSRAARRSPGCRSPARASCSSASRQARASATATRSAASRRSAGAALRPAAARAARVPVARPDLRTRRRAPPTTGAWRRALFAAGLRAGDLVHNSFSYHLTPAGSMMESGAHGARLHRVPRRRRQHRAAVAGDGASCGPTAYVGTPSFLRILLEKAAEAGDRLPRCARPWSAARPSRRACATWLRRAASRPTSATRTADLGLIAYETAAREGLVLDEGVIVEIVRPGHRRAGARRARSARSSSPRSTRTTRWCASAPATSRRCCPGPARPAARNTRIRGWLGPRRPDGQGARHVRAPGPGGRDR